MTECPFCAIVAGEEEAHVLREDEHTIAFLDVRPASRGHTLVAPTEHIEELLPGPRATVLAVEAAVSDVARALADTLEPDGFSTFYTSGSLVGTVDHAHVHVVPRYEDDDVSISLSRSRLQEGEELAAAIRADGSWE